MRTIASRRNPLVSLCRRLARHRDETETRLLLEGPRLLQEAEAAHLRIVVAAFSAAWLEDAEGDSQRTATRLQSAGTSVVRVTPRVMAALSPADTPSGVLAIAEQPRLGTEALWQQPAALVVIAVDVSDPGNLGALVRSVEAADASGLICCGATANPFGWKALRGAMGSAFRLPIVRERDVAGALTCVRAHGLHVAAAVPSGGVSIYDSDLGRPTALMLGSEPAGLTAAQLAQADVRVSIPMRQPVESLNVAVAGAVVAYEAWRQRRGVRPDRPASGSPPGRATRGRTVRTRDARNEEPRR